VRNALDDRLVDLRPAGDVVALTGQEFLQDMGGTVCLKSPDLHLAEPLSAELRLTAERLLGDKRVRADGPCMDLVVDQVRELVHIYVTNGHLLLELITCK